jgi:putative glutathione S-transferase
MNSQLKQVDIVSYGQLLAHGRIALSLFENFWDWKNAISLGTASPMRPRLPHVDWEFSLDTDEVDPILGIQYMSEIYKNSDPNYSGRPTVPAIVDIKSRKIVNNDYFKLTKYLETD